MKKIITKGTDTYRASCSECGTTFTYERDDVHTNYVKGGEWVSCPHCGHGHRHYGAQSPRGYGAGAWGRSGSGCDLSFKIPDPHKGRWLLAPPGRRWN